MTTKADLPAFSKLLERAVLKAGGLKQNAAREIGIGPSRFSKLLNNPEYLLSPPKCFRLARFLGESPQTVLRIVGNHDLADALDYFYGQPADVTLAAAMGPSLEAIVTSLADLPDEMLDPLVKGAALVSQLYAASRSSARRPAPVPAPTAATRTSRGAGRRRRVPGGDDDV